MRNPINEELQEIHVEAVGDYLAFLEKPFKATHIKSSNTPQSMPNPTDTAVEDVVLRRSGPPIWIYSKIF